mmetsp:Transcript_128528/g.357805  ORF Transcript_128528/g.357805 Transcript_128528/m.357805 type:complete len:577 (+) Transcript_128528:3-1733(+)
MAQEIAISWNPTAHITMNVAQRMAEFIAGSPGAELPTLAVELPPLAIWGNLAIYVAAWALLMWPHHLPLGRPGIAMVFAALACALRSFCHAAWPEKHYATINIFSKVDPTPIALLFGLFLVNAYLKETGIWRKMQIMLDSPSPVIMLLKICGVSAVMSAFLLNDTMCLVLTPMVINLCRKHKARSALPFLLGISMSCNIGSALTIIGNPQNALIASISEEINFVGFMQVMLTPTLVGLCLNTTALVTWFRSDLVFEFAGAVSDETLLQPDAPSVDSGDLTTVDTASTLDDCCADDGGGGKHSECLRSAYLVTVGVFVAAMFAGWALGLSTDGVALATGCGLMAARALRRRLSGNAGLHTETDFAVSAIDPTILILFFGQFVLVGATVDTGVPQRVFSGVLGGCASHLGSSPPCIFWFSIMVMFLSNVISNVPVILMLQPLLSGQPAERLVWQICAWVATVSGNLTMLGSAANLIVAHGAESMGETSYTATSVGKFSILPTLMVSAVGVMLQPPLRPHWAWMLSVVGAIAAAVLALASKAGFLNPAMSQREAQRPSSNAASVLLKAKDGAEDSMQGA